MSFTFLLLSLLIALLDWLAVARHWKPLEFVAKPGVMLALLAWLYSTTELRGQSAWFALGLVFSLLGDVFLMLPREQFIAGLVAFLLAHLAYLIGFNPTFPPINLASLILAVLVGATVTRVYRLIVAGLLTSGQGHLKIPVLVYSAVISLMLLSALYTLVRPEWSEGAAWLASSGAMLFFLSDTILAWNKFVHPLSNGRLLTMITYHLGQALIVVSVTYQFRG